MSRTGGRNGPRGPIGGRTAVTGGAHATHLVAGHDQVARADRCDAGGTDVRAGAHESGRERRPADLADAVAAYLAVLGQAEHDSAAQGRPLQPAQHRVHRRDGHRAHADQDVQHVARRAVRRQRGVGECPHLLDHGRAPAQVVAGHVLDRVVLDPCPADRPGRRPHADAGVAQRAQRVAAHEDVEARCRTADEHSADLGAAAVDPVAGDLDVVHGPAHGTTVVHAVPTTTPAWTESAGATRRSRETQLSRTRFAMPVTWIPARTPAPPGRGRRPAAPRSPRRRHRHR